MYPVVMIRRPNCGLRVNERDERDAPLWQMNYTAGHSKVKAFAPAAHRRALTWPDMNFSVQATAKVNNRLLAGMVSMIGAANPDFCAA